MNLQKIILLQEQVIGDTSCPVISVADASVYENGKRTEKTDGKKVTCVCPKRDYEKITVRVPSVPITQEQIDAAAEDGEHIFVSFENFEGRIYIDKSGKPQISAKATAVKIEKE